MHEGGANDRTGDADTDLHNLKESDACRVEGLENWERQVEISVQIKLSAH